MNNSTKLRVFGTTALAMALLPMAAYAQTSPAATASDTTTTTSATTATDDRADRHEHHNYGWIGLLGLLGLTGLMRRGPERRDTYDTTAARRTDTGSTDVNR